MNTYFNKLPLVQVTDHEDDCVSGWNKIGEKLIFSLPEKKGRMIVAIETYQGVYLDDLIRNFSEIFKPDVILDTASCLLPASDILEITRADVTDDRVFGYLSRLNMDDLLDPVKVEKAAAQIRQDDASLILIIGYGATLIWEKPDMLVYADMARWEIQQRMRRNEVDNLGISNKEELFELKYKRGYFVDWRICDRLKKETMLRWDFVLDSNRTDMPKLASGDAIREGLRGTVRRPFSVAPFFDPGPWGGQWMKERFGLDPEAENYAWCFNCVPEENSLLLGFGDTVFEIPSINLLFSSPVELLGDAVHARFGEEFPIRFDFLDTMDGGNLSLQVHPLTGYIQEQFGMHYTQDESYYMLDAAQDASVFLGLKEGVDPDVMTHELRNAEKDGDSFDVDRYVENWPAKKHDHFLIPAGTVHCSGENGMVLEISATPYIFTFKLYDWGRVNDLMVYPGPSMWSMD